MGKSKGEGDTILSRFQELKSHFLSGVAKKSFLSTYKDREKREREELGFVGGKKPSYSQSNRDKQRKIAIGVPFLALHRGVSEMIKYNDDHFGNCARITIKAVIDNWKIKSATDIAAKTLPSSAAPLSVSRRLLSKRFLIPTIFCAQVQRNLSGPAVSEDMRLEMGMISHFWSDQMAGGHVRTPRNALRKLCGRIQLETGI